MGLSWEQGPPLNTERGSSAREEAFGMADFADPNHSTNNRSRVTISDSVRDLASGYVRT